MNHASAIKFLQKKKENRSFSNFIKVACCPLDSSHARSEFHDYDYQNCEANPVCRNLNLQSYLIKPIQRLTKYPLLLKDMMETCSDPVEKRQITLVQDRIVKIVAQLNEDQRLTENREQVLEIVSKFGDKNDKVSANTSRFFLSLSHFFSFSPF